MGTELKETSDFLEVYYGGALHFSIQKSAVFDWWQQAQRRTDTGEKRGQKALECLAKFPSVRQQWLATRPTQYECLKCQRIFYGGTGKKERHCRVCGTVLVLAQAKKSAKVSN